MERQKYVVIMAAGSGTRMGEKIPKQFLELGGKAILRRTIEVFLAADPQVKVIVVLPPDHIPYWREYCYKNSFICPQVLVKGGITRFHSVKNALAKVPDGAVVAIHDGVRPLVSETLVRELFARASKDPAVIPVIPMVDTLKALSVKEWTDSDKSYIPLPDMHIDRSHVFGAQTPQVFHSELLKSAYNQPYDTSFTDDASVVENMGATPVYVPGEKFNIKITTKDDLDFAKAVLLMRAR